MSRAPKQARPSRSGVTDNHVEVTCQRVRPPFGVATVRRRAEKMLAVLGLEGTEISIALVDDDAIRALNAAWRKKDRPTDVLAFPLLDDPLSTLATSKGPVLLGDVVVSLDTAARQARERGRHLLDEVTTLLAHGTLHLCGLDHRTDEEERAMEACARVLEAAASARRPLAFVLRPRPAGGPGRA